VARRNNLGLRVRTRNAQDSLRSHHLDLPGTTVPVAVVGMELPPKWNTAGLLALLINDPLVKVLAHEVFYGLHKLTHHARLPNAKTHSRRGTDVRNTDAAPPRRRVKWSRWDHCGLKVIFHPNFFASSRTYSFCRSSSVILCAPGGGGSGDVVSTTRKVTSSPGFSACRRSQSTYS